MEVQGGGLRPSEGAVLQLDTIRALHQTVVSLRSALEASKSELHDLKQKYESHSDSAAYSDTIKKLTLENDALRGKLNEPDNIQEVKDNVSEAIIDNSTTIDESINTNDEVKLIEKLNESSENSESIQSTATVKENKKKSDKKIRFSNENTSYEIEDKSDSVKPTLGQHETTIELESKYDVTIKVSAGRGGAIFEPLEVTSSDFVTVKSDADELVQNTFSVGNDWSTECATAEAAPSGKICLKTSEEINMAGSRESSFVNKNGDKFNIQVKITSEENLAMDPYVDRESASEHLNVEADEISTRSVSEGDNSVFSDAGGTITGTVDSGRRVCEQDSISGNDSEEVDDIELIFTTDEKEFTGYQEDLVSITDGENWTHGDTNTPVLLKFNLMENDDEIAINNGRRETLQEILRQKSEEQNESLDKVDSSNIGNIRGCLRNANNKMYLDASDKKHKQRFESNDSLSFETTNKSLSFDTTKSSSLDRGSSIDIETRDLSFDQRDESLDQLDALRSTMRTKYSVYVETDISKCGVMEDDTFPMNLSFRRNTCPNPFQYRPLSHRDAVKGSAARPLLTPAVNKGPRRSSAAQTDISALPNHWRSDTHLAKKVLPSVLTTLPGKTSGKGTNLSRLLPPAPMRPTHISEENRRVMLSDIGFTSMVPELSRSAEPIWGSLGAAVLTPSTSVTRLPLCCTFHATPCYGSVPSSPTRQEFKNSDPRYWSKSSIQRSVSGRMGEITPGTHRVSFIDQPMRSGWRGSLPELRKSKKCCVGGHRFHKMTNYSGSFKSKTVEGGESGDSTEELLDEAERFLRSSIDCMSINKNVHDDFITSRWSRPYLPTVPRQLRLGHLVKVIAPHGRITLGKVRYVGIAGGPVAAGSSPATYVGIQLRSGVSMGGDGSFHGRRYFHCEPGFSLFVPFSKVVVAWADV